MPGGREAPRVVVVAGRLVQHLTDLVADTAAGTMVAVSEGRDVAEGRGVLWLVEADHAEAVAKRFGRRPAGPEQLILVHDGRPPYALWWARSVLAADLVAILPAGADVIREAVTGVAAPS